MASSEPEDYTAKFTDGPLEGKTMTVKFLESGDPQPRLEIPTGDSGTAESGTVESGTVESVAVEPGTAEPGRRRFLYARGTGLEFAGDDPSSARPSAVDYRYLQVLVG